MAHEFGELVHERDRAGNVRRRFLLFWVKNPKTGKVERERLYSGLTQHGERVPFESDEIARAFLEGIRADVRHGRSEWQALAPFLYRRSPENLVPARWRRYVKARRAQRVLQPVSDARLYELERMPERGYLDFFKDCSIFELTDLALRNWVLWMIQRWPEHRPKTRHHIVHDFLGFLHELKAERDIAEVPSKPPLPPLERRRKPVPAEDVLTRYLAAIPEEIRGLWLARSHDGLRPSEARRLRVGSYSWKTRAMSIEDSKTETGIRTFVVDWEVGDWLERHVPLADRLDPDAPLFRNPNAPDGWWKQTPEVRVHRAACTAIGVYFPPNHAGRHAAATHMMRRTKAATGSYDIDAVKRKLGHVERSTTEGYIDQRVIEVGSVARLRPGAKGRKRRGEV